MLPQLLLLTTTLLFGILAIYLSFKEEKTKKELRNEEKIQRQKIYQIAVLKEIQDRIGYSLDIEKVIDVITGSLADLFPYSTASSMVVKDEKIVFKTYIEESVSHSFVQNVKTSMLASLSSLLDTKTGQTIDESISGVVLNDQNQHSVTSFFHIPLIVQGKVVGLINVSSTKPNLYKESDMTILYQIVETASNALSRLQNVLQTEKGKLMATITSLADGVFMIDTKNELLIINDAAKKFMDINIEEPTVIDIYSFFNALYPLSVKVKEVIHTRQSVEEKEVKLHENIVQVFIHPVIDEETNTVLGASVLLHDITLEKNLSLMKEDFTNMMVHELRAPLTAIKGSITLLKTDKDKMSRDEQEKFLSIVENEASRLLSQVSSLLDAAKLEAGKMTLSKTPTDINSIILEKVAMFAPQAAEKNIILKTNLQHSLPAIALDQTKINQVLNNLISNSIKYTKENGSISIATEKADSSVKITVSDTGIGIPKEKQAHLFSKFYQVASPTAMQSANLSSGLGLYITKGIIDAHYGTISIISEEGKGTTFTITLPIGENVNIAKPIPAQPSITSPLTISSSIN